MSLRLRCGEQSHAVEVRPGAAGGLAVTVDGHAHEVALEEVAPGTYLLRHGGAREVFHCVRDGEEVHLAWRGQVYRLEREREGRTASRHAAGGLEAPMPGKVTAVKVAPGQAVRKGEELLVVEAMKMENALRAPRDGTVRSVAARVGDMVSPGVVLVELE